MTSKRDDFSVSRLELVVLARHSASKPPGQAEIEEAVQKLAATSEARARADVAASLTTLRQRGLLTAPARTTSRLSDAGKQALRAAFSLTHTPTWVEVRDKHLPALGLNLTPGTDAANRALGEGKDLFAEVLHAQFGLPRATSITELCNTMLLDALGLSPPSAMNKLTLSWLRTRLLARKTDMSESDAANLTPAALVRKAVVKRLKVDGTKRSLVTALGRRWITGQADHNLGPAPVAVSGQLQGTNGGKQQPTQTTPPHPPDPPFVRPVPREPSPEMLLKVVREVLPRVGADGRFGTEKVFVSAIWRGIERDQRVEGMSFDGFKRWLLTANRQSQLVLARADLVAAMDRKQVSESEIADQGSTFHFVLDKQPNPGSERRSHAR